MKKLFISLLIGLSLFTVGCSCTKKEEEQPKTPEQTEEELHLNTSSEIIREQTVDGINFKNVTLLIEEGISKFSCQIENPKDEARVLGTVTFTFKNDNGEVVYTQDYPVDVLSKKEVMSISFTTDINLSKATKLEYTIKA